MSCTSGSTSPAIQTELFDGSNDFLGVCPELCTFLSGHNISVRFLAFVSVSRVESGVAFVKSGQNCSFVHYI